MIKRIISLIAQEKQVIGEVMCHCLYYTTMKTTLTYTVFILSTVVLYTGCSVDLNRDYKKSFLGNWYYCYNDGVYLEMLVRDTTFKFCGAFGLTRENYPYTISEDTLYYRGNTDEVTAVIKFEDENTMILNYLEMGQTWTYKRISEKVLNYPAIQTTDNNWMSIYLEVEENYTTRSANTKCEDFRSEEEKGLDSLRQEIYFKF